MARHHDQVFGSLTVKKVIEKFGLPDESSAVTTLKANLKAEATRDHAYRNAQIMVANLNAHTKAEEKESQKG